MRVSKNIVGFPLAVALSIPIPWISACRHEESSSSAAPSATPQAPAATPLVGMVGGKAEYHEEAFDLTMRPSGALTAGAPGSVEIQLLARGGYHCNDKYPYKFKVGESSGVKFRAPVFTLDAVTLEEKRATMKLELTPETKGEQTVRGVFAFSVCTAERCLVEKRELEIKIPVI